MKKEKNIIKVQRYESPCGLLLLGSFGDKLCLCDWQVEKHRDHVDRRLKRMLCSEFEVGTSEVIEKAARQLDEFFAGKRKEFDVPLLFVGTDFQKTVWNELLEIPFGKTVSYGEMAQRIGMSKAVRAVANANGAKTFCLVGYDGGKLRECAQSSLHVAINNMQIVEDIHMIIDHMGMSVLRDQC